MSSTFFSPHHHIGLPRTRFYSSYNNYDPYSSNATTNMRLLYALIGINVAVFSYASYLKMRAAQGDQAPFIKFMQNMTMNLSDFKNGRWWTIVTANFTHIDVLHLGSNMLTVYFLGQFVAYAPQITPIRFLIIAFGSGVAGAAGFLYNRSLRTKGQHGPDYMRGLGFSGVVMGIISVGACLAPTAKVAIYGIIPVPLWLLAAGYAGYDGYYLNSENSRIGHAGHLGGLAFGLAYYALRLRGLRRY